MLSLHWYLNASQNIQKYVTFIKRDTLTIILAILNMWCNMWCEFHTAGSLLTYVVACLSFAMPISKSRLNHKHYSLLYIVEQITAYVRRIVQIMIQATYLAQILYRGLSSRKNAGHAKFQYGRHFPRWPPRAIPKPIFFGLKGQQMVEKGNYDDKFHVLSIADAQIML